MNKDAVVACIRERMRRFYQGDHIEAACLYWAEVAFRELVARGE